MLNQFTGVGRLAYKPEIKQTQSGKRYAVLQVAIQRDYENRNGERETDLLPVSVWGKAVSFVEETLGEGDLVCFTGPIQRKQYTAKDGQEKVWWEVNAQRISLVEGFPETVPRAGDGSKPEAPKPEAPKPEAHMTPRRKNSLHQPKAPQPDIERPPCDPELAWCDE